MNTTLLCLVVDFQRNRIRLYKNVLQSLGNPSFVRLLINPAEKIVAVQVSDHNDPRAHRISNSVSCKNQRNEIYSTQLMQKLLLCGPWDASCAYRLTANGCVKGELLTFRIDDSIQMTQPQHQSVFSGIKDDRNEKWAYH